MLVLRSWTITILHLWGSILLDSMTTASVLRGLLVSSFREIWGILRITSYFIMLYCLVPYLFVLATGMRFYGWIWDILAFFSCFMESELKIFVFCKKTTFLCVFLMSVPTCNFFDLVTKKRLLTFLVRIMYFFEK